MSSLDFQNYITVRMEDGTYIVAYHIAGEEGSYRQMSSSKDRGSAAEIRLQLQRAHDKRIEEADFT